MIRVENLNKTYDRRSRNANHVLKDVSFTLPDTGFICILGPSGCGKTSLLNALGGLDQFDNGTIATGDCAVSHYGSRLYEAERNRNFGYIFQNYYLLPEHSVAYNIYLGLHSLKLSHAEKLKRVRNALAAVDMSRYIRRKVGELSGGQQQRIAIARALARQPRVIFADEPTGNLDEANTMNICTLLRQISKESLVIMVTHEERIASFFADRIIRLDGGVVAEDSETWDRSQMQLGNDREIYAGDYQETGFQADSVSLRILQEEGAAPAELTVAILHDRIVIRLNDGRTVSCGGNGEMPIIREGKRPTLTLETVDRQPAAVIADAPAPQAPSGHGIRLGMMLQEARHLFSGGGAKSIGIRLFLILMTVLTMWTVCDFITVASIDPEDFIKTDSHILQINMKRGPGAGSSLLLDEYYLEYKQFCDDAPSDVLFIPASDKDATFTVSLFAQMDRTTLRLNHYNRVPLTSLDPEALIYGHMPTKSGEIVLDRWVLEAMLQGDSVAKNAVTDVSYFLDRELSIVRANYKVTVVGISDSGEPAMYLSMADLIRTSSLSNAVILLTELQAAHPGQFDDVVLAENECIVNTSAAGNSYASFVGDDIELKRNYSWIIKDAIPIANAAKYIIADSAAPRYLQALCNQQFMIYCQDKMNTRSYLSEQIPEKLASSLTIDVFDAHSDAMESYTAATALKADARSIVTVTVLLVSMVMLYLLCRAQVRDRIGMLAVYRLLGITGRKLRSIFLLEALLASAKTALPVAALTWVVFQVQNWAKMIMPWPAAMAVYAGILLYHLVVAILPLGKLLRLPPAQLAAKYDY